MPTEIRRLAPDELEQFVRIARGAYPGVVMSPEDLVERLRRTEGGQDPAISSWGACGARDSRPAASWFTTWSSRTRSTGQSCARWLGRSATRARSSTHCEAPLGRVPRDIETQPHQK